MKLKERSASGRSIPHPLIPENTAIEISRVEKAFIKQINRLIKLLDNAKVLEDKIRIGSQLTSWYVALNLLRVYSRPEHNDHNVKNLLLMKEEILIQ